MPRLGEHSRALDAAYEIATTVDVMEVGPVLCSVGAQVVVGHLPAPFVLEFLRRELPHDHPCWVGIGGLHLHQSRFRWYRYFSSREQWFRPPL